MSLTRFDNEKRLTAWDFGLYGKWSELCVPWFNCYLVPVIKKRDYFVSLSEADELFLLIAFLMDDNMCK